jgi:hypothetical protein
MTGRGTQLARRRELLKPAAEPMGAARRAPSASGVESVAQGAGYSPEEIVGAPTANPQAAGMNVKAALGAGYSPAEIVDFLNPNRDTVAQKCLQYKDFGWGPSFRP